MATMVMAAAEPSRMTTTVSKRRRETQRGTDTQRQVAEHALLAASQTSEKSFSMRSLRGQWTRHAARPHAHHRYPILLQVTADPNLYLYIHYQ